MSRPGRQRVSVLAPAKLNLSLRVLGRREDGYHALETTMIALRRWDRLELVWGEPGHHPAGDSLVLSGPFAGSDVPRDGSNLALRAIEAVRAIAVARGKAQATYPLRLSLHKEIPAGAGLGGGSADAAAAALGAAELLGLDARDGGSILQSLASIGSDCAFFFAARHCGIAWCRGRGEHVTPLASPTESATQERAFCVLTPAIHASTRRVFGALQAPALSASDARTDPTGEVPDPASWFRAPLEQARTALVNELESAALASVPGLQRVRRFLDENEADHFRLSGSGSSFFGLFADPERAERVRERLSRAAAEGQLPLRALFVTRPAERGATLDSSN